MNCILNKLDENNEENKNKFWQNWTQEEIYILLQIYHIISKKESCIFDLINSFNELEILKNYNDSFLNKKAIGIENTLELIDSRINININIQSYSNNKINK
jgi:hypothetical protein